MLNMQVVLDVMLCLFVNNRLQALVQASKEGIDPQFKKQVYYSRILTSQLGGERKIAMAEAKGEADPGGQIQLDVTLRQMKEAYDSSPKPTVIPVLCSDCPVICLIICRMKLYKFPV